MKDKIAFEMCLLGTAIGTLKGVGEVETACFLLDKARELLTDEQWQAFENYTEKEGPKILLEIMAKFDINNVSDIKGESND